MTELSLLIRTEQPIDSEAIERLHERAFGPGRFDRTASRLREGASHLLDLSFTARCASSHLAPVSCAHCIIIRRLEQRHRMQVRGSLLKSPKCLSKVPWCLTMT